MNKSTYEEFLSVHRVQLESSKVPELFWKSLFCKLTQEKFDAGETFSLLKLDFHGQAPANRKVRYELQVNSLLGVDVDDPKQIYLIDHAWTFRIENAKEQLRNNAQLRDRMSNMMGVNRNQSTDKVVDDVFDEMWKYCGTYWISSAENVEDRLPIWYMMDEVGSAITHSDEPNFEVVPFIYLPTGVTYSIMFPLEDVIFSEVITRNFLQGNVKESEKPFRLLPWQRVKLPSAPFKNLIPAPSYFLEGHIEESLPDLENIHVETGKTCFKVYTEYDLIGQYLKSNKYQLVNHENEADILWLTRHFKDFKTFSKTPHKFINQFPFEYVLTIKDLLAITCHRLPDAETSPIPITYNLKYELDRFVSYFKSNPDTYWIVKPFNLARGLGIHVTKNLNFILRLMETGPKLAQKYVENPVTFLREECGGKVKFDVRYMILLKSVKPLRVFLYRKFFLRFANKPFDLHDLDCYEKHFTVMNYSANSDLKKMLCEEFVPEWESQYPDYRWQEIENSIAQMLKKVMEASVLEKPPCGIAESPQSRAMYAADIILEWNRTEIRPQLLEINWTPDCKRACDYYPDFFNHIFDLLFTDEENLDLFIAL